MQQTRSTILGIGHYVPTKVVTNDDLSKLMSTTDEWIVQRTGIKERRFIEHTGIGASDLAIPACKMALEQAKLDVKDVDAIIFATLSPDHNFPGSGCFLGDKLGLPGIPALDVRNQCSGFLYGLSIADAWVRAGVYENVLLVGAEVLPKNIGVVYRRSLQPYVVWPLWTLRRVLAPITWACNVIVRWIVPQGAYGHRSDEEIILLAERGARHGTLSQSESSIIANALSLDDVRVGKLMTPRTVVTALRRNATIADVFREFPNLPFGRMPVYGRNLDDIVGLARRRDLFKAKANGQDLALVESVMQETQFIPETATAANALQLCMKSHQQLLVAVDEFGATAGVITMEDLIEHLLGGEIFEKDDLAVDMRELARSKLQKSAWTRRAGDAGSTPPIPPKA